MEAGPIPTLSPRKRDVLRLIHARRTNKEIGILLGISAATVGGYVETARAKIGVADRRAAADWYAVHGDPSGSPGSSKRVSDAAPSPPRTLHGGGHAWRTILPIRQEGAPNDLSLAARAIWPFVLAIALACGFGMFATGAAVVSRFLGAFG